MRKAASVLAVLFIFFLSIPTARSEEQYAGIVLSPPDWSMREMQTFAGSVPSRAWLYGCGEAEAVLSVLMTEGITGGLEGQDFGRLAKLYLEAFIAGWGGKSDTRHAGLPAAPFCGGRPGYKTTGTFGEVRHDYYVCLLPREDNFRIVTVVTWLPIGSAESEAGVRMMSLLSGIKFLPPAVFPEE